MCLMQERETPLLIATRLGATDIVRTLLEHKANPNMVSIFAVDKPMNALVVCLHS